MGVQTITPTLPSASAPFGGAEEVARDLYTDTQTILMML